MKRELISFSVRALAVVIGAAWIAGCEKKSSDGPPPSTGDTASVEAKLARADAVDGTVDKVVSKCGACALGMDGSKAHSFAVSGYTLQFCSAGCKSGFEKDPSKAILAMSIPGE